MKDSIKWALGRGMPVIPVLEVEWTARGNLIDTVRYAPTGDTYPGTFARPLVSESGFNTCAHGARVDSSGTLETTRTSVILGDGDRELRTFLERYYPKDSPAVVYWASPQLVKADWQPLYTGIVDGWANQGPQVELLIGPDDREMRAEVPKPLIERPVWSAAPNADVWGMSIPYVFGFHDAFQLTGRGMIPAIPVRYDETRGYRWLASGGLMNDITRVYFDGILQSDAIWSVESGVFGSVEVTLIDISAPPDSDAIVSFDGEGPDTDGRSGGTSNVNPVTQLRKILENYVFGDLRVGGYATSSHPRIDGTSWDAVADYFTDRDWDSGVVIGGTRDKTTGRSLMESFLKGYPWVRAWWTPEGKIALMVLDPSDDDPPADWTNLDRMQDHSVEHDALPSDVYSDVNLQYLWSAAEQKFMATYVAQDVGLSELQENAPQTDPHAPAILSIENQWTQARFTRE